MKLARYIDHAVLNPGMTRDEIIAAVKLGIKLDVYSVCMHPRDVKLASELCKGTNTMVGSVVDFPHGAGGVGAKKAISEYALMNGAKELDMVMNYSAAKSGDWDTVKTEIETVVKIAHANGAIVKVIFETSEIDTQTIEKAVDISVEAGADFVKTSTGFASSGATVEAVQTMLNKANGRIKVKPSGGIRTAEIARQYIEMGASRLGIGYSGCEKLCKADEELSK